MDNVTKLVPVVQHTLCISNAIFELALKFLNLTGPFISCSNLTSITSFCQKVCLQMKGPTAIDSKIHRHTAQQNNATFTALNTAVGRL